MSFAKSEGICEYDSRSLVVRARTFGVRGEHEDVVE